MNGKKLSKKNLFSILGKMTTATAVVLGQLLQSAHASDSVARPPVSHAGLDADMAEASGIAEDLAVEQAQAVEPQLTDIAEEERTPQTEATEALNEHAENSISEQPDTSGGSSQVNSTEDNVNTDTDTGNASQNLLSVAGAMAGIAAIAGPAIAMSGNSVNPPAQKGPTLADGVSIKINGIEEGVRFHSIIAQDLNDDSLIDFVLLSQGEFFDTVYVAYREGANWNLQGQFIVDYDDLNLTALQFENAEIDFLTLAQLSQRVEAIYASDNGVIAVVNSEGKIDLWFTEQEEVLNATWEILDSIEGEGRYLQIRYMEFELYSDNEFDEYSDFNDVVFLGGIAAISEHGALDLWVFNDSEMAIEKFQLLDSGVSSFATVAGTFDDTFDSVLLIHNGQLFSYMPVFKDGLVTVESILLTPDFNNIRIAAIADLNGNDAPDIIIVSGNSLYVVELFARPGKGDAEEAEQDWADLSPQEAFNDEFAWTIHHLNNDMQNVTAITVADINGNGQLEIIVDSAKGLQWWHNPTTPFVDDTTGDEHAAPEDEDESEHENENEDNQQPNDPSIIIQNPGDAGSGQTFYNLSLSDDRQNLLLYSNTPGQEGLYIATLDSATNQWLLGDAIAVDYSNPLQFFNDPSGQISVRDLATLSPRLSLSETLDTMAVITNEGDIILWNESLNHYDIVQHGFDSEHHFVQVELRYYQLAVGQEHPEDEPATVLKPILITLDSNGLLQQWTQQFEGAGWTAELIIDTPVYHVGSFNYLSSDYSLNSDSISEGLIVASEQGPLLIEFFNTPYSYTIEEIDGVEILQYWLTPIEDALGVFPPINLIPDIESASYFSLFEAPIPDGSEALISLVVSNNSLYFVHSYYAEEEEGQGDENESSGQDFLSALRDIYLVAENIEGLTAATLFADSNSDFYEIITVSDNGVQTWSTPFPINAYYAPFFIDTEYSVTINNENYSSIDPLLTFAIGGPVFIEYENYLRYELHGEYADHFTVDSFGNLFLSEGFQQISAAEFQLTVVAFDLFQTPTTNSAVIHVINDYEQFSDINQSIAADYLADNHYTVTSMFMHDGDAYAVLSQGDMHSLYRLDVMLNDGAIQGFNIQPIMTIENATLQSKPEYSIELQNASLAFDNMTEAADPMGDIPNVFRVDSSINGIEYLHTVTVGDDNDWHYEVIPSSHSYVKIAATNEGALITLSTEGTLSRWDQNSNGEFIESIINLGDASVNDFSINATTGEIILGTSGLGLAMLSPQEEPTSTSDFYRLDLITLGLQDIQSVNAIDQNGDGAWDMIIATLNNEIVAVSNQGQIIPVSTDFANAQGTIAHDFNDNGTLEVIAFNENTITWWEMA